MTGCKGIMAPAVLAAGQAPALAARHSVIPRTAPSIIEYATVYRIFVGIFSHSPTGCSIKPCVARVGGVTKKAQTRIAKMRPLQEHPGEGSDL